ncbi:MAG: glycoside hydrolase family 15 protein, partial [Chloroflexota bacterium]|nr:glycoside hydrolase family 15 protein [Chloroflexota bacterium]
RTAALVSADGAIDWCCLPDYASPPRFGALLDPVRGGFWRMGPATPTISEQTYQDASAVLQTTWSDDDWALELTDAMAWPWNDRAADEGGFDGRVIIRRLRCTQGAVDARLAFQPRYDFAGPLTLQPQPGGITVCAGPDQSCLWVSRPVEINPGGAGGAWRLETDEEVWAVLAQGVQTPIAWSVAYAQEVLAKTATYWSDWANQLRCAGDHAQYVRRTALTIHLLSYAPTGALVAAPTTSLPERIGGDRNWDYRYAWVRDASLSAATLVRLGDLPSAERYMDWMAGRGSSSDSPLQIVYGLDGALHLPEEERDDLAGYRDSLPVRTGNRACSQRQLDSLGFLADCALIYLQAGGAWRDPHWDIIRRAADYTAANWRMADSGIWELQDEYQFVSSKVMSWVTLDRAIHIAGHIGRSAETDSWQTTRDEIHADVMEHGWSERLGAFRQRYEADSLDASALLIPIFGFLPPTHPRVEATIERIEQTLRINGHIHRFVAAEIPGEGDLPVGEHEGAFWPCTFWLATAHALAGRTDRAGTIIQRAIKLSGALGLFSEEIDAHTGAFLGNTPLLFSHVEFARAALAVAAAR